MKNKILTKYQNTTCFLLCKKQHDQKWDTITHTIVQMLLSCWDITQQRTIQLSIHCSLLWRNWEEETTIRRRWDHDKNKKTSDDNKQENKTTRPQAAWWDNANNKQQQQQQDNNNNTARQQHQNEMEQQSLWTYVLLCGSVWQCGVTDGEGQHGASLAFNWNLLLSNLKQPLALIILNR